MGWWLALLVSAAAAGCVASGSRFALTRTGTDAGPWPYRMMALGTGVLLMAVLLDFLPDSWENAGALAPWGMAVGIVLMGTVTFASDVWFARTTTESPDAFGLDAKSKHSPHHSWTRTSALVLMFSLSFHTFLEGFSLSIAMVNVSWASLWFSLAMLIHKVPEGVLWGLSILTAFPDTPESHARRLAYALLIPAGCVFAGTVVGIWLQPLLSPLGLGLLAAIIAGALLFICLTELVPAVRDHATQIHSLHIWFFAGLVLMLIPIGLGHLLGGG